MGDLWGLSGHYKGFGISQNFTNIGKNTDFIFICKLKGHPVV